MEVVPDDDVPHAEARHQDALDKILRAEDRKLLVEGQNHGKIELVAFQQRELLRQRRQPEMRAVRLEELSRMRLEHHGTRQPAVLCDGCAGSLEEGLMAAMHAVEIANRERGSPGLMGNMVVSVNDVHGTGDGCHFLSASKDSKCRPEVKPRWVILSRGAKRLKD
jgi:hypothetical protein